MTAIRTGLPAALPAMRAVAPVEGARAAQRAFFQAALTAAAPAEAQPAPKAAPASSGEAPARNLRPGSLIDIRV